LPDGSCGDDSNVAYVDAPGIDNASCTKLMPRTKVSSALATARANVKITGTVDESVMISNRTVALLGAPNAGLTGSISVQDTSDVGVFDLATSGISVATGCRALVTRARISSGTGVLSAGTLTISESTVTRCDTAGVAIRATAGSLVLQRSRIVENYRGGIAVSGSTAFDIQNNFIAANGSNSPSFSGGSAIGAVNLVSTAAAKFAFNTVVWNTTEDLVAAGTYPAGIVCSGAQIDAHGNISSNNTEGVDISGTGPPDAQVTGNCQFGNTFAQPSANLEFAATQTDPYDLHLTTMSPATVVDAAGSCDGVDYDGMNRPKGNACDLGADERAPF
jgi:hypothetical protein